jgi:hypothetical protein
MNLYKQFVKETGLKSDYVKWLESKLTLTDGNSKVAKKPKVGKIINMPPKDYETIIDYDDQRLSYQVRVDFPRGLKRNEQELVEGIINYWSALPFVSVEGNYGIDWPFVNVAIIDIDFTKSASDDYMSHEILEKLAEWIWQGTPIRKTTKDRKWEGVIKPTKISADCP